MKSLTYACILSALMALALGLASAQDGVDSTESDVVITDASMIAPSPEKQNHTYTFPDFVLLAGTSVKVHTGSGDDAEEDLYCNRNTPIWNNDGDVAALTDAAGNVVAMYPEEITGA
jgi:hypothetical protein